MDEALRKLKVWTGAIEVHDLHGGLSNQSWKVTDRTGRYVARKGRDYPFHHVFRDREAMTAKAAAALGFGPEVVFAGDGIMVSRFVEGRTWTASDLALHIPQVADLLGRFHKEMMAQISGPGFAFWPFHVNRDYLRQLRGSWPDAELDGHLALNAALEKTQVPLPLVFGHNDLLPANFIQDKSRLWLIDYEYAGFSTAMFDLAGVAGNAGFDTAQNIDLLRFYFGEEPSQALRAAHSAMICAALLREALWAGVSALHLATPGVDFAAYAAENLAKLQAALARHQKVFGAVA